MLFILNEEEDREEAATRGDTETEVVELKTLEVMRKMEITLRTILGFTSKGTMKLNGILRGREVIILNGIVEELKLPLAKETNFGVTIGDGSVPEGRGICKHVEIKLPELTTTIANFLATELGKIDVLGMQWLSTTGFMGMHWPSTTMTFMVRKSQIILKGEPTLEKTERSLKMITKTWEVEDQGFLLEFQNMEFEEGTEDGSEYKTKI